MAKKKTAEKAKIEAAPVLRALGGEDPTPETPVITKSYSMRDDWKDKGVVNTVAFKSVDGEITDLLVNGEPAGGGGTDTAKVTIINSSANSGLNINIDTVLKDRSGEYNLPADTWFAPGTYEGSINAGQTKQIDVVIIPPNGGAMVFFSAVDHTYSVTGSATKYTFDYGVAFLVTGDCSITIS